jgi:SAM-dependent methyltransferase
MSSVQRVRAGSVWRSAKRLVRLIVPRRDYVVYRGSRLPRPESRLNRADQRDNAVFLDSSIREARRVIERLNCGDGQILVDIGCGQGRLPIGLLKLGVAATYRGLDVSKPSIEWCRQHIEHRHPQYSFEHINLINARYNPSGVALTDTFRLPFDDAFADAVYMWGVVTNMEPDHLATYAAEISRILRGEGMLFLTANVEEGVPEVSINPENYTPFACDGPLHIVRYEREFFLGHFRNEQLKLTGFDYHAAGNCQSDMYFRKESHSH